MALQEVIVDGRKITVPAGTYEEWAKTYSSGDGSTCGARSTNGYRCTRDDGHSGYHIAHAGRNSVCEVWASAEEDEKGATMHSIKVHGETRDVPDWVYTWLVSLYESDEDDQCNDCGYEVYGDDDLICTCTEDHDDIHVAHGYDDDHDVISVWHDDWEDIYFIDHNGQVVAISGEDHERYKSTMDRIGKRCHATRRSVSGNHWACTRAKGHDGDHVGHFSNGSVGGVWDNSMVEKSDEIPQPIEHDHKIRVNGTNRYISHKLYEAYLRTAGETKDYCREEEPHSYLVCSREKGHGGVHVAHEGMDGVVLAVWDQKGDLTVEEPPQTEASDESDDDMVMVNGEKTELSDEQLAYYASTIANKGDADYNGYCRERDPHSHWSCTKRKGHTGAHVAHVEGTGKVLAVWYEVKKVVIGDDEDE